MNKFKDSAIDILNSLLTDNRLDSSIGKNTAILAMCQIAQDVENTNSDFIKFQKK